MINFKHKLSIVAIMKYEEPYVLEWVAYHHCIGVQHFYIYDNDENSSMKRVLGKYISAGIVTLISAPGPVMMFKCYNDATSAYKDESKYIAFIDADEYLMPIEDTNVANLVDDLITTYHEKNERVSGLVVKWATYGSGKHIGKPQGLVLENYLYRENGFLDRHLKTIVNPRKVSNWCNPHFCIYDDGTSVDEAGLTSFGPFMYADRRDVIRLNHYYYKSESEFKNRIRKGKCDITISKEEMEALIEDQMPNFRASNKDYDPIMLRYTSRVNAEMERYRNC